MRIQCPAVWPVEGYTDASNRESYLRYTSSSSFPLSHSREIPSKSVLFVLQAIPTYPSSQGCVAYIHAALTTSVTPPTHQPAAIGAAAAPLISGVKRRPDLIDSVYVFIILNKSKHLDLILLTRSRPVQPTKYLGKYRPPSSDNGHGLPAISTHYILVPPH